MSISAPEPLNSEHDVSDFSCGKPTLEHWLKARALSNNERGFTAVMVMHEAGRVVGYYGLAPTAVAPSMLSRSVRTGQPPDPVPCILLDQLATDLKWTGRGIGSGLLKHSLKRCVQATELIGGRAYGQRRRCRGRTILAAARFPAFPKSAACSIQINLENFAFSCQHERGISGNLRHAPLKPASGGGAFD